MADDEPLKVVKSEPLPTLTVNDAPAPKRSIAQQLADFVGRKPTGDALPFADAVGPKTRALVTDPLAHSTGIDALDSLTSPLNLALTATMGAAPAARLVNGAVTNLTDRIGSVAAAKILKFITPSIIKKPAELADVMAELSKAFKAEPPPAAPASPAAAGPPQAAPVAPAATNAAPASPPPAPVAAAPEAPPNAPAAPVNGDVSRATIGQTPAQIANSLNMAAARAKVTLSPAQLQTAFKAVQGGAPVEEALASVTQAAPVAAKATLTAPESALMQKMRAAGKTDAEIATAIQNNRAFIAKFGTPTPTAAETRFPKGQRGGGVPEP